MKEDGIMLSIGEDGNWEIYKEPFATIECKTEEDYNKLKAILERQTAKKPIEILSWKSCPMCEGGLGVIADTPNPKAVKYCYHCGQKLDWN